MSKTQIFHVKKIETYFSLTSGPTAMTPYIKYSSLHFWMEVAPPVQHVWLLNNVALKWPYFLTNWKYTYFGTVQLWYFTTKNLKD